MMKNIIKKNLIMLKKFLWKKSKTLNKKYFKWFEKNDEYLKYIGFSDSDILKI